MAVSYSNIIKNANGVTSQSQRGGRSTEQERKAQVNTTELIMKRREQLKKEQQEWEDSVRKEKEQLLAEQAKKQEEVDNITKKNQNNEKSREESEPPVKPTNSRTISPQNKKKIDIAINNVVQLSKQLSDAETRLYESNRRGGSLFDAGNKEDYDNDAAKLNDEIDKNIRTLEDLGADQNAFKSLYDNLASMRDSHNGKGRLFEKNYKGAERLDELRRKRRNEVSKMQSEGRFDAKSYHSKSAFDQRLREDLLDVAAYAGLDEKALLSKYSSGTNIHKFTPDAFRGKAELEFKKRDNVNNIMQAIAPHAFGEPGETVREKQKRIKQLGNVNTVNENAAGLASAVKEAKAFNGEFGNLVDKVYDEKGEEAAAVVQNVLSLKPQVDGAVLRINDYINILRKKFENGEIDKDTYETNFKSMSAELDRLSDIDKLFNNMTGLNYQHVKQVAENVQSARTKVASYKNLLSEDVLKYAGTLAYDKDGEKAYDRGDYSSYYEQRNRSGWMTAESTLGSMLSGYNLSDEAKELIRDGYDEYVRRNLFNEHIRRQKEKVQKRYDELNEHRYDLYASDMEGKTGKDLNAVQRWFARNFDFTPDNADENTKRDLDATFTESNMLENAMKTLDQQEYGSSTSHDAGFGEFGAAFGNAINPAKEYGITKTFDLIGLGSIMDEGVDGVMTRALTSDNTIDLSDPRLRDSERNLLKTYVLSRNIDAEKTLTDYTGGGAYGGAFGEQVSFMIPMIGWSRALTGVGAIGRAFRTTGSVANAMAKGVAFADRSRKVRVLSKAAEQRLARSNVMKELLKANPNIAISEGDLLKVPMWKRIAGGTIEAGGTILSGDAITPINYYARELGFAHKTGELAGKAVSKKAAFGIGAAKVIGQAAEARIIGELQGQTLGASMMQKEFDKYRAGMLSRQGNKIIRTPYEMADGTPINTREEAIEAAKISTTGEYGSEMTGEALQVIGSTIPGATKYLPWLRAVGNTAFFRALGNVQKSITKMSGNTVSSIGYEFLEEVVNNVYQASLNMQPWGDVVDVQQNADTFLHLLAGMIPQNAIMAGWSNIAEARAASRMVSNRIDDSMNVLHSQYVQQYINSKFPNGASEADISTAKEEAEAKWENISKSLNKSIEDFIDKDDLSNTESDNSNAIKAIYSQFGIDTNSDLTQEQKALICAINAHITTMHVAKATKNAERDFLLNRAETKGKIASTIQNFGGYVNDKSEIVIRNVAGEEQETGIRVVRDEDGNLKISQESKEKWDNLTSASKSLAELYDRNSDEDNDQTANARTLGYAAYRNEQIRAAMIYQEMAKQGKLGRVIKNATDRENRMSRSVGDKLINRVFKSQNEYEKIRSNFYVNKNNLDEYNSLENEVEFAYRAARMSDYDGRFSEVFKALNANTDEEKRAVLANILVNERAIDQANSKIESSRKDLLNSITNNQLATNRVNSYINNLLNDLEAKDGKALSDIEKDAIKEYILTNFALGKAHDTGITTPDQLKNLDDSLINSNALSNLNDDSADKVRNAIGAINNIITENQDDYNTSNIASSARRLVQASRDKILVSRGSQFGIDVGRTGIVDNATLYGNTVKKAIQDAFVKEIDAILNSSGLFSSEDVNNNRKKKISTYINNMLRGLDNDVKKSIISILISILQPISRSFSKIESSRKDLLNSITNNQRDTNGEIDIFQALYIASKDSSDVNDIESNLPKALGKLYEDSSKEVRDALDQILKGLARSSIAKQVFDAVGKYYNMNVDSKTGKTSLSVKTDGELYTKQSSGILKMIMDSAYRKKLSVESYKNPNQTSAQSDPYGLIYENGGRRDQITVGPKSTAKPKADPIKKPKDAKPREENGSDDVDESAAISKRITERFNAIVKTACAGGMLGRPEHVSGGTIQNDKISVFDTVNELIDIYSEELQEYLDSVLGKEQNAEQIMPVVAEFYEKYKLSSFLNEAFNYIHDNIFAIYKAADGNIGNGSNDIMLFACKRYDEEFESQVNEALKRLDELGINRDEINIRLISNLNINDNIVNDVDRADMEMGTGANDEEEIAESSGRLTDFVYFTQDTNDGNGNSIEFDSSNPFTRESHNEAVDEIEDGNTNIYYHAFNRGTTPDGKVTFSRRDSLLTKDKSDLIDMLNRVIANAKNLSKDELDNFLNTKWAINHNDGTITSDDSGLTIGDILDGIGIEVAVSVCEKNSETKQLEPICYAGLKFGPTIYSIMRASNQISDDVESVSDVINALSIYIEAVNNLLGGSVGTVKPKDIHINYNIKRRGDRKYVPTSSDGSVLKEKYNNLSIKGDIKGYSCAEDVYAITTANSENKLIRADGITIDNSVPMNRGQHLVRLVGIKDKNGKSHNKLVEFAGVNVTKLIDSTIIVDNLTGQQKDKIGEMFSNFARFVADNVVVNSDGAFDESLLTSSEVKYGERSYELSSNKNIGFYNNKRRETFLDYLNRFVFVTTGKKDRYRRSLRFEISEDGKSINIVLLQNKVDTDADGNRVYITDEENTVVIPNAIRMNDNGVVESYSYGENDGIDSLVIKLMTRLTVNLNILNYKTSASDIFKEGSLKNDDAIPNPFFSADSNKLVNKKGFSLGLLLEFGGATECNAEGLYDDAAVYISGFEMVAGSQVTGTAIDDTVGDNGERSGIATDAGDYRPTEHEQLIDDAYKEFEDGFKQTGFRGGSTIGVTRLASGHKYIEPDGGLAKSKSQRALLNGNIQDTLVRAFLETFDGSDVSTPDRFDISNGEAILDIITRMLTDSNSDVFVSQDLTKLDGEALENLDLFANVRDRDGGESVILQNIANKFSNNRSNIGIEDLVLIAIYDTIRCSSDLILRSGGNKSFDVNKLAKRAETYVDYVLKTSRRASIEIVNEVKRRSLEDGVGVEKIIVKNRHAAESGNKFDGPVAWIRDANATFDGNKQGKVDISGEADIVVVHDDGSITIVDLKTSNAFNGITNDFTAPFNSDAYIKQLALYKHAYKTKFGTCSSGGFVRVRRTMLATVFNSTNLDDIKYSQSVSGASQRTLPILLEGNAAALDNNDTVGGSGAFKPMSVTDTNDNNSQTVRFSDDEFSKMVDSVKDVEYRIDDAGNEYLCGIDEEKDTRHRTVVVHLDNSSVSIKPQPEQPRVDNDIDDGDNVSNTTNSDDDDDDGIIAESNLLRASDGGLSLPQAIPSLPEYVSGSLGSPYMTIEDVMSFVKSVSSIKYNILKSIRSAAVSSGLNPEIVFTDDIRDGAYGETIVKRQNGKTSVVIKINKSLLADSTEAREELANTLTHELIHAALVRSNVYGVSLNGKRFNKTYELFRRYLSESKFDRAAVTSSIVTDSEEFAAEFGNEKSLEDFVEWNERRLSMDSNNAIARTYHKLLSLLYSILRKLGLGKLTTIKTRRIVLSEIMDSINRASSAINNNDITDSINVKYRMNTFNTEGDINGGTPFKDVFVEAAKISGGFVNRTGNDTEVTISGGRKVTLKDVIPQYASTRINKKVFGGFSYEKIDKIDDTDFIELAYPVNAIGDDNAAKYAIFLYETKALALITNALKGNLFRLQKCLDSDSADYDKVAGNIFALFKHIVSESTDLSFIANKESDLDSLASNLTTYFINSIKEMPRGVMSTIFNRNKLGWFNGVLTVSRNQNQEANENEANLKRPRQANVDAIAYIASGKSNMYKFRHISTTTALNKVVSTLLMNYAKNNLINTQTISIKYDNFIEFLCLTKAAFERELTSSELNSLKGKKRTDREHELYLAYDNVCDILDDLMYNRDRRRRENSQVFACIKRFNKMFTIDNRADDSANEILGDSDTYAETLQYRDEMSTDVMKTLTDRQKLFCMSIVRFNRTNKGFVLSVDPNTRMYELIDRQTVFNELFSKDFEGAFLNANTLKERCEDILSRAEHDDSVSDITYSVARTILNVYGIDSYDNSKMTCMNAKDIPMILNAFNMTPKREINTSFFRGTTRKDLADMARNEVYTINAYITNKMDSIFGDELDTVNASEFISYINDLVNARNKLDNKHVSDSDIMNAAKLIGSTITESECKLASQSPTAGLKKNVRDSIDSVISAMYAYAIFAYVKGSGVVNDSTADETTINLLDSIGSGQIVYILSKMKSSSINEGVTTDGKVSGYKRGMSFTLFENKKNGNTGSTLIKMYRQNTAGDSNGTWKLFVGNAEINIDQEVFNLEDRLCGVAFDKTPIAGLYNATGGRKNRANATRAIQNAAKAYTLNRKAASEPVAHNEDGNVVHLINKDNGLTAIVMILKQGKIDSHKGVDSPYAKYYENMVKRCRLEDNENGEMVSEFLNDVENISIDYGSTIDNPGIIGGKNKVDYSNASYRDDAFARISALISCCSQTPTLASSKSRFIVRQTDEDDLKSAGAELVSNYFSIKDGIVTMKANTLSYLSKKALLEVKRAEDVVKILRDKWEFGENKHFDFSTLAPLIYGKLNNDKRWEFGTGVNLGRFGLIYIPVGVRGESGKTGDFKTVDVNKIIRAIASNKSLSNKEKADRLLGLYSTLRRVFVSMNPNANNEIHNLLSNVDNGVATKMSIPSDGITGGALGEVDTLNKFFEFAHEIITSKNDDRYKNLKTIMSGRYGSFSKMLDDLAKEEAKNYEDHLTSNDTIALPPIPLFEGSLDRTMADEQKTTLLYYTPYNPEEGTPYLTYWKIITFLNLRSQIEFEILVGSDPNSFKSPTEAVKRYQSLNSTGSIPAISNESLENIPITKKKSFDGNTATEFEDALAMDEFGYCSIDELIVSENAGESEVDCGDGIKTTVRALFEDAAKTVFTEDNVGDHGDLEKLRKNWVDSRINAISGGDISGSDGACFIHPDLYKDYLIKEGRYKTHDIEVFFDMIKEGKPFPGGSKYAKMYHDIIMSPLKLVYVNNEAHSVEGIPTGGYAVNKMAVFPLLPSVYKEGSVGRKLYDIMEKSRTSNGRLQISMIGDKSIEKSGGSYSGLSLSYDDTTGEVSPGRGMRDNGATIFPRKLNIQRLVRQLETHTHEDDERMIGSQLVAMIMSDIDYSDGATIRMPSFEKFKGMVSKTVSTKQVSARLMERMYQITSLSFDAFMNKWTVVKDGKRVVPAEVKTKLIRDNVTGKGLMSSIMDNAEDTPLDLLMNESLFESAILAEIRKEVERIETIGSTYIQVPQSGLRTLSSYLDKDVDTSNNINRGQRLKLVNEYNAMDCVLSINAFKGILDAAFPDGWNFDEARQFLIDQGIIGSPGMAKDENGNPTKYGARPLMVGYRVPTQSKSSIPALRCVDVVPNEAGDVIYLPDGFIAITGSDFDIDKLYIAMPNFTFDADSNSASVMDDAFGRLFDDNYKDEDDGSFRRGFDYMLSTGKIDNNGYNKIKDSISSGLILDYISILTSPDQFVATHTSIDSTTVIFKGRKNVKGMMDVVGLIDDLKVNFDGFNPSVYKNTLAFQLNKKQENAGSREGIAPYAIASVNHVYAQIAKLSMNNDLYDAFGTTSLHDMTSRDGVAISQWMSAMVSAHVDAVKDPYILLFNINKFTWSAHSLMLRAGLGSQSFYITRQDVIRMLSEINRMSTSVIREKKHNGWSSYKIENTNRQTMFRQMRKNISHYLDDSDSDSVFTVKNNEEEEIKIKVSKSDNTITISQAGLPDDINIGLFNSGINKAVDFYLFGTKDNNENCLFDYDGNLMPVDARQIGKIAHLFLGNDNPKFIRNENKETKSVFSNTQTRLLRAMAYYDQDHPDLRMLVTQAINSKSEIDREDMPEANKKNDVGNSAYEVMQMLLASVYMNVLNPAGKQLHEVTMAMQVDQGKFGSLMSTVSRKYESIAKVIDGDFSNGGDFLDEDSVKRMFTKTHAGAKVIKLSEANLGVMGGISRSSSSLGQAVANAIRVMTGTSSRNDRDIDVAVSAAVKQVMMMPLMKSIAMNRMNDVLHREDGLLSDEYASIKDISRSPASVILYNIIELLSKLGTLNSDDVEDDDVRGKAYSEMMSVFNSDPSQVLSTLMSVLKPVGMSKKSKKQDRPVLMTKAVTTGAMSDINNDIDDAMSALVELADMSITDLNIWPSEEVKDRYKDRYKTLGDVLVESMLQTFFNQGLSNTMNNGFKVFRSQIAPLLNDYTDGGMKLEKAYDEELNKFIDSGCTPDGDTSFLSGMMARAAIALSPGFPNLIQTYTISDDDYVVASLYKTKSNDKTVIKAKYSTPEAFLTTNSVARRRLFTLCGRGRNKALYVRLYTGDDCAVFVKVSNGVGYNGINTVDYETLDTLIARINNDLPDNAFLKIRDKLATTQLADKGFNTLADQLYGKMDGVFKFAPVKYLKGGFEEILDASTFAVSFKPMSTEDSTPAFIMSGLSDISENHSGNAVGFDVRPDGPKEDDIYELESVEKSLMDQDETFVSNAISDISFDVYKKVKDGYYYIDDSNPFSMHSFVENVMNFGWNSYVSRVKPSIGGDTDSLISDIKNDINSMFTALANSDRESEKTALSVSITLASKILSDVESQSINPAVVEDGSIISPSSSNIINNPSNTMTDLETKLNSINLNEEAKSAIAEALRKCNSL